MKKGLTDKQESIFNFIKEKILIDGYPPSIREIALHFGICAAAIYQQLSAMRKKGFIAWIAGASRTLKITGEKNDKK